MLGKRVRQLASWAASFLCTHPGTLSGVGQTHPGTLSGVGQTLLTGCRGCWASFPQRLRLPGGLPRGQRLERGLPLPLHPDFPHPHHSAQCHFLQGAPLTAPATLPSSSAFTARTTLLGPGSALQHPGLPPAEEGPFPQAPVTGRHLPAASLLVILAHWTTGA